MVSSSTALVATGRESRPASSKLREGSTIVVRDELANYPRTTRGAGRLAALDHPHRKRVPVSLSVCSIHCGDDRPDQTEDGHGDQEHDSDDDDDENRRDDSVDQSESWKFNASLA